jgi:hypothetical protein
MSKRFTYWDSFASFTPFFSQFANGKEGWSLDRLVAGYSGKILTIVRPSDLATQDIYLNGNSVDTAAILSFVGSQKALVKNVYGQLGNFNLNQNTTAKMPIIADGGVIMTDNGKPCIVFDGIDDTLIVDAGWTYNKSLISALFVSRNLESGTPAALQLVLSDGPLSQIYIGLGYAGNSNFIYTYNSPSVGLFSIARNTDRQLIDLFANGTTTVQYGLDGSNVGSTTTPSSGGSITLTIGNWVSGNTYATNMKFQELVLFDNADRSSEKSAMRANINSRYTIY